MGFLYPLLYFSGNKMEDEMGRVCGMHDREEKYRQGFGGET